MTRSYNERMTCQNCGKRVVCPTCNATLTTETPFEFWMRNQGLLDSVNEGVVRFDLDVLIHRYKNLTDVRGDRTVQVMMFVEVKTFNATCSDAQKDTLHLFNQVLSNHRANNKGRRLGWHTDHNPPVKARSLKAGKDISLFLRGGHCLILSGDSPDRSSSITWDKKPITESELVQLLRCELDPDTLQPWDIRRRQVSKKQLSKRLFD